MEPVFLEFCHLFPGDTDPISAAPYTFNKVPKVDALAQTLIKWLMQIHARKGQAQFATL